MSPLNVILLSAILVGVTGSPAPAVEVGDNCVIRDFNQVSSVLSKCTNIVIADLTVPGGVTLNLKLKDNSKLTFQGTTRFEHHNWKGPLAIVSGNKIEVTGAPGSTLDGLGDKYWDGKGDKGVEKPKFFKIKAKGGSVFRNLNIVKCPVQCVSIDTSNAVTLTGFNIDVSMAGALGHNTDGFDISSTNNLLIENAQVKNQDDCVAVNKGTNMVFRNIRCSGGHGLSLSVGQSKKGSVEDNTVRNVTFENCEVADSDNGIHVKTHSDAGPGALQHVTYNNIRLSGIRKYAINIEQDYEKGKPTGKPKNNIPITDFTANQISGSMTGKNSKALYILCASGGCKNWHWSGVNINGAQKPTSCTNAPVNC
ncbi:hypothetical protein JTB14_001273 [Gonioctena quinquepunctata]|nr:hypothetical protein JTB14_001273 [Gonioctena quinquepunctata]